MDCHILIILLLLVISARGTELELRRRYPCSAPKDGNTVTRRSGATLKSGAASFLEGCDILGRDLLG